MPFDGTEFEKAAAGKARDLTILRRALAGLKKRDGWVKGHMGVLGQHCAVGWMAKASGSYTYASLSILVERLLVPALPPLDSGTYHTVTAFNDAPHRRKQDIVRLFEEAIRLREAKP
jgi:hypothetical protein